MQGVVLWLIKLDFCRASMTRRKRMKAFWNRNSSFRGNPSFKFPSRAEALRWDDKRFRRQSRDKPCRLLFVAHREELLKQSLCTFRAVRKDANFGEVFVGS